MNASDPTGLAITSSNDLVSAILILVFAATAVLYTACACCVSIREYIISLAIIPAAVRVQTEEMQTEEQTRCSTVPHPFSNRREYAI
jgi:hypothetical protein